MTGRMFFEFGTRYRLIRLTRLNVRHWQRRCRSRLKVGWKVQVEAGSVTVLIKDTPFGRRNNRYWFEQRGYQRGRRGAASWRS